jgi:uncharacterized delta-60 repeat protein
LLLQPDNKIITTGNDADGSRVVVVRQNPDGTLDQTFGNGGTVTAVVAGAQFNNADSSVLQSDGKIILYGDLSYGGVNSIFLTRFNSDGTIDNNFGNNGSVVAQFGAGGDGAEDLAIQPADGKIVVTGTYNTSGTNYPFVIRYNPDGSYDQTFGSGGYVLGLGTNINFPGTNPLIQSDGKIILGGSDQNQYDAVLARLNANGSLDTSFGINGFITTHLGAGNVNAFRKIVLQSDGKILGAGAASLASNDSSDDWALARYADITNTSLTINPISNATINEGDTYTATGSFTDPNTNATSWTATVDYGDGTGSQPLTLTGMNFSLNHQYKDEGTYTVTVSVTDNQGATGTGTATITVNNATPSVGTISTTTSPVKVNTSITASANFTDPGILDTHTASWNWGDGNNTPGTVTETNGSGTVSNTHTYTSAGLYIIKLTVTDDDSLQNSSTYQYVVVYNPAKTVNGSGHILSPQGAEPSNPSATGTGQFAFNAQYNPGATLPSGNVQYNFNDIKFNLTSFNWVVVTGNTLYLQGVGRENGAGTYTIFESASTVTPNTVRVRITDSNNNVIYDNQMGAALTAIPTEAIADGHVTIQ